jgi:diguanylate cyclase (GGDEF)-like protein
MLIVIAVVALAAAVWSVTEVQRSAAETTFRQGESAQLMLAGMLDQQTGARGFALTGQERFLAAYHEGRGFYREALAEGREASRGDPGLRRSIDAMDRTARQWQRLAILQIEQIRSRGRHSVTNAEINERKKVLDRFRRENSALRAHLRVTRAEQLSRAGMVAVAVVLALSLLFAGVGHVMVQRVARGRRTRQEAVARERAEQAEFAEAMLVARDEREANGLVKRHLERVIAGSDVTMLSREVGGQGLRAMTDLTAGSPLATRLDDAVGEDCLAVRLGRPHHDGPGRDRLLRCGLCGAEEIDTFCVPSVVGNDIVGSVLVQRDQPLDDAERARVRESAAHSAPVLTNLRTISSAELRATTDQLTGLPNRRAVDDELDRMVAQAGRTKTSLTAIVLDIDHFKQVNDRFGHHVGDTVLSAVGATLSATLRASDFAGRYGGEEFVLLLPDTCLEGATIAADKVRREIMQLVVPDIGETATITASLGVAVLPDHASQGDSLLRQADRALYAAKANGRNRVEAVATVERTAESELATSAVTD